MPDPISPDSTAPIGTAQTTETTAPTGTAEPPGAVDRAEALAARVRAMDAEMRAIEAEAQALSAETAAGPDGGAAGGGTSSGVRPDASEAVEAPATTVTDQALVPADGLERREFVRRVTSDAVVMAGKFYSLSRVITRSATAAGQAVIADLESIRRDQEPEGAIATGPESSGESVASTAPESRPTGEQPTVASAAAAPAATVAAPLTTPTATPPSTPQPPPPPVPLNLTPEQEALLERVRLATLGVNRAGLSPHLTAAQFHWDGLVLRIPSLGWASRTTNIRREPHATLFVEDPETGEFGAISGMTTIVERRSSVREQNGGLLRRYYPDIDPEEQWTKLLAEDPDRVLLVLEPGQTIWGRRA